MSARDREDSDRLLEQVERANLFLQPLDENQQWYRYHMLWAQAMQHEARQAQPFLSEHSPMYSDNMLVSGLEAFLAGEIEVAWQHTLEA